VLHWIRVAKLTLVGNVLTIETKSNSSLRPRNVAKSIQVLPIRTFPPAALALAKTQNSLGWQVPSHLCSI
jgi:hypothetical protein